MAETLRFTSAHEPRAPQYELVPRLRSLEPNLEVYRQLRVPVLRAHPRHVLLAGRIRDLRLRCFAALGLQRGYFSRGTSRLAGYLLGRDDPLAEIAMELAMANYNAELDGYEHPAAIRASAAQTYAAFQQDEPEQAERRLQWHRHTEGLVSAAILGRQQHSSIFRLRSKYRSNLCHNYLGEV